MTHGETLSEELLALYHDLWDLRIRASRLDRSFLVYLLDVALEDVNQGLTSRGPGKE